MILSCFFCRFSFLRQRETQEFAGKSDNKGKTQDETFEITRVPLQCFFPVFLYNDNQQDNAGDCHQIHPVERQTDH
jgi:hypothetical protein